MTASVALGVAVDDTIHFLTWFRRGIGEGLSRVDATMLAYDRCATAMAQTTLIGGLGLAVFATSTFTPTQQFGYLMITMLATALVGDLLLLPALLASPLGHFFSGNAPRKNALTKLNGLTELNGPTDLNGPAMNERSDDERSDDERSDWEQNTQNTATHYSKDGTSREAATSELTTSTPTEPKVVMEAEDATPTDIPNDVSTELSTSRSESPHAALHAKLQNLRRKHSNDSLSP
jgi:hypothetical protein